LLNEHTKNPVKVELSLAQWNLLLQ